MYLKHFFFNWILIVLFASIIFIGDAVEFGKNFLLRGACYLDINIKFFKFTKMLLEILPFCLFFLWNALGNVSNTKELIVMRTSGLTIRKITLPIF